MHLQLDINQPPNKDILCSNSKYFPLSFSRYVSVMFNIRTETQLLHQQELAVLFSEATLR